MAITGVSGTLTHGSPITISGSGFGTHSDNNEGNFTWQGVAPLAAKFKDFEDGNILSGGWSYQQGGSFQSWNLASGGRANSSHYGSRIWNGYESDALQYTMSKMNASNQVWVSFWFMIPPNTSSGKFFRLWGSSSEFYVSTGCDNYMFRYEWESPDSFVPNTWHKVEMFYNGSNSTLMGWMDHKLQWTYSISIGGGNGHTLDIGQMKDEPGAGRCPAHPTWAASYNYDDIYIDYTTARFELANHVTWASVTQSEIQIPTSWSDTSCQIRLNTGAFASNASGLYLHRFSTSNVATDSYGPITLGGGGVSPPSGTPTLSVR
jgi:hypothetical protein